MSQATGPEPRILLVEDDPVSRSFLEQVLAALPARVQATDTIAAALALPGPHDLWLIDANLPDGDGIGLLASLRARAPRTAAIAHTADDSPALHARLRYAGFDDVLVKPLSVDRLLRAAGACLRQRGVDRIAEREGPSMPALLWDDKAALVALKGNRDHLDDLRGLFLRELQLQLAAVQAASRSGDLAGMRRQLHQLRASCGFVGAMQLGAAAARLSERPEDPRRLQEFEQVATATSCAA